MAEPVLPQLLTAFRSGDHVDAQRLGDRLESMTRGQDDLLKRLLADIGLLSQRLARLERIVSGNDTPEDLVEPRPQTKLGDEFPDVAAMAEPAPTGEYAEDCVHGHGVKAPVRVDSAIWTDPARMGGAPCLKGTRFPVEKMLGDIKDLGSVAEFASQFSIDVTLVTAALLELAREGFVSRYPALPVEPSAKVEPPVFSMWTAPRHDPATAKPMVPLRELTKEEVAQIHSEVAAKFCKKCGGGVGAAHCSDAFHDPKPAPIDPSPVEMLLFCPKCHTQHIDAPQPEKNWENPPHRSHECQACGHVWRPADVPTNGVAKIMTQGQRDGSPVPASREAATTDEVVPGSKLTAGDSIFIDGAKCEVRKNGGGLFYSHTTFGLCGIHDGRDYLRVSRASVDTTPIQLRVGHRYRRRDGVEAECVERFSERIGTDLEFSCKAPGDRFGSRHHADGRFNPSGGEHEFDIVADLGPVKTEESKPRPAWASEADTTEGLTVAVSSPEAIFGVVATDPRDWGMEMRKRLVALVPNIARDMLIELGIAPEKGE